MENTASTGLPKTNNKRKTTAVDSSRAVRVRLDPAENVVPCDALTIVRLESTVHIPIEKPYFKDTIRKCAEEWARPDDDFALMLGELGASFETIAAAQGFFAVARKKLHIGAGLMEVIDDFVTMDDVYEGFAVFFDLIAQCFKPDLAERDQISAYVHRLLLAYYKSSSTKHESNSPSDIFAKYNPVSPTRAKEEVIHATPLSNGQTFHKSNPSALPECSNSQATKIARLSQTSLIPINVAR